MAHDATGEDDGPWRAVAGGMVVNRVALPNAISERCQYVPAGGTAESDSVQKHQKEIGEQCETYI